MTDPSQSPTASGRGNPGRTTLAVILLIIGLLTFAGVVPTVWLQRTLLTTDGWVDAVAPIPRQPAVQDAVAGETSDIVMAN